MIRAAALCCMISIVLTACTVPIRSMDRTVTQADFPHIGELQAAEVGAKLMTQQDIEVIRGKKLHQVTRSSMGVFPADFSGMYVRANEGEHYCGIVTYRDPLNYGKQHYICFTAEELASKNLPLVDAEEIIPRPQNLQRVLEYSGKSGATVSLVYKEFNETNNGAFIRPAFTQEFKFDLSEGNVVGVKGARLEILEASNTGIRYKVLNHFPRL